MVSRHQRWNFYVTMPETGWNCLNNGGPPSPKTILRLKMFCQSNNNQKQNKNRTRMPMSRIFSVHMKVLWQIWKQFSYGLVSFSELYQKLLQKCLFWWWVQHYGDEFSIMVMDSALWWYMYSGDGFSWYGDESGHSGDANKFIPVSLIQRW